MSPDGASNADSAAEGSLRGAAAGRKNWMFSCRTNGGRTAAVLTSVIATCKRHDTDPFDYLCDAFEPINAHTLNRIEELLPDRWAAARITAKS